MNVNQWGVITAAMVLSSLPVIIIFLVFSEQIENALTAGAILK
jgi:raffinose/stachyose/melibiose transport system permease protein